LYAGSTQARTPRAVHGADILLGAADDLVDHRGVDQPLLDQQRFERLDAQCERVVAIVVPALMRAQVGLEQIEQHDGPSSAASPSRPSTHRAEVLGFSPRPCAIVEVVAACR
jgi:hypothetical protein